MTLAFLGRVADERLADVVTACRHAASSQAPFSVTLDRAGRFPEGGAPRVVWLGLGEGAAEISSLATAVRDALTTRGVAFDAKPFRAHVTLARVKDDVDRPTARAIAAAAERLSPTQLRFMAQAIVPFESVLCPRDRATRRWHSRRSDRPASTGGSPLRRMLARAECTDFGCGGAS